MTTSNEILGVLSELEVSSSIKEKKAILKRHSSDIDLANYCKWVLDPGHNFYITKVPAAAKKVPSGDLNEYAAVVQVFKQLAYNVRGNQAKALLVDAFSKLNTASKVLIKIALDRKLPGNVGRSIVNHAWPGLVYKQPYGGVASYDAERLLTRFDWSKPQLIEAKEDGMTLIISKENSRQYEVRTRAGQDVTDKCDYFMELLEQAIPTFKTLHVEANLYEEPGEAFNWNIMDRAESNGIFNALFQGSRLIKPEQIRLTILDVIDTPGFFRGKDTTPAIERLGMASNIASNYYNGPAHSGLIPAFNDESWPYVLVVEHGYVTSPEEARAWAQRIIRKGGEGAVLKDPAGIWESKKMLSQMKLKNEFECTLKVTGWKPHKNHPEWVGSLLAESAFNDGIKTYVGSGLNEEPGHELNRAQGFGAFDGKLIEVKAECITKNNALQLPRIIEIRKDKELADTFDEVLAAYNDSKGAA